MGVLFQLSTVLRWATTTRLRDGWSDYQFYYPRVRSVVNAMKFLHDHNIVHQDLKFVFIPFSTTNSDE